MNISQIEENVKALAGGVKHADFLYDLLECYGKPKASITRLKIAGKGSYNLSKKADEVLWKKQVYYKATNSDKLLTIIDEMRHADVVAKHQPRFIIAINATHLLAIDAKNEDTLDIPLAELNKKFDFFLPWAGLEKTQAQGENPADVKAAEKMAKLFDLLRDNNAAVTAQEIHAQNVFLSRILFCYFAEDTGIFDPKLFTNHVASHTAEDGADLDDYLTRVFDVMNLEERIGLPDYLTDFPYVNGGLFADKLPVPKFNRKSRAMLIECGADLNWSEINPDIFGSMIQAVVDPDERGNMGMHYTSVPNIMKVIEPLFLNELKAEFEKHSDSKTKLEQLLLRFEHLKIFDPACGSGNFLIIAYKELRQLEMEIFKRLQQLSKEGLIPLSRIKLSQFYGIELGDFAHEVAILSLWLAEHQMNQKFKATFGYSNPALPLKSSGNIIRGNALRMDWAETFSLKADQEIFILGNPPYVGYSERDDEQKEDMEAVFANVGKVMRLDYICCWLKKSGDFMAVNRASSSAFLSTSSICQGEQASLLWPYLFSIGTEIFFAHQSFKWSNNAKGNAGVSCIVAGIRNTGDSVHSQKLIYTDGLERKVKNINQYLVDAKPVSVDQRSDPISAFPEMALGSSAIDGGNLILSEDEANKILKESPESAKFIKPYIGGEDFLDGKKRFCLWIGDQSVAEALKIPAIANRVEKCRTFREKAGRDAKKAASVPQRFFYRKFKEDLEAIVLPMTSSERRTYIPVGVISKGVVPSNGVLVIYTVTPLIFGIVSSKIHMAWVHAVSGRLESRIRYSVNLTYNNFPFPAIDANQEGAISAASLNVLSIRENYPELTLGQLYDPEKMPMDLVLAHRELDIAVDKCYRNLAFSSNEERLEYLFKLYEKMTEAAHA